MIDERTKELISGALDGELTDADKTELDQRLAESGEARDYQIDMQQLNTFLEQVPTQVMPKGLHEKIVDSVVLPASTPVAAPWTARAWPGVFPFGLAAAAGLLLMVGIYQFGSVSGPPSDLERMVGTMARYDTGDAESFSFESKDLSSRVRLERRDTTLALNVDIESAAPIELRIDYGDTALRLQTAVAEASQPYVLEFDRDHAGALHARSRGKQKFTVLFERDNNTASDKDSAIRLEYSSNGKLVQQGVLVPRW